MREWGAEGMEITAAILERPVIEKILSHLGLAPLPPARWVRTTRCHNHQMRPSSAMSAHRIDVLALAAARGASRVRVFGSTARGEDRDGSDLDLLVDLPAGTSLLTLVALQQDLADTLGVPVDLLTERELDPVLAPQILAQARPL